MAEYLGSCTGSSGNKYDLTLYVNENSRSISQNKSNITFKLFVRRNDGYKLSAYNLNENENSAQITVDSKRVAFRNLKIDTRYSEKVLLSSYTGDFYHSSDGNLSLSVNASFKMGGTGLSGGSVSKTISFPKIDRPSSVSFNKNSVAPGAVVTGTVKPALDSFSHKVIFSLGQKSITKSLGGGVKEFNFTVPLDWANEVKNAKKAKISAVIYTYNGSSKIGSKTSYLDFFIPDTAEFKPNFNFTLTKIDSPERASWQEYIKNISKLQVKVESPVFKYGASLKKCEITVCGSKKTGYEGTFNLTQKGEVLIKITLFDSRGISQTKQAQIEVLDYFKPSIKITSLKRCNEIGELDQRGSFVKAFYTVNYSNINNKNQPTVKFKYRQNTGSLWSGESIVGESPSVLDGSFLINSSYILGFFVTDTIGSQSALTEVSLNSSEIPFNIRKFGKGAAFGKFSEYDNLLDVDWGLTVRGETNLLGGVKSVAAAFEPASDFKVWESNCIYYPFLNMCFVRLKIENLKSLLQGSFHSLGSFKAYAPKITTPLISWVGPGFKGEGVSIVSYNTGELLFAMKNETPINSNIYISGYFFADSN